MSLALAFVIGLLAAAGGLRAQDGQQPQEALPAGLFGSRSRFTEASGEAIYRGVCAGCHMPDGQGAEGAGRYPSLARDPRLAVAVYPIQTVLHGRGAMPPFQRLLSDDQIAAVVGYIRQGFGNAFGDPPLPDQVRALR